MRRRLKLPVLYRSESARNRPPGWVTFPVPERSPFSWRCRTYAAIAAVSQLPCRVRAVGQASSLIPTTDLIVSDQRRNAPSDRKGSSSHQSLTGGQARASALRQTTGFAVGDSEPCPFLFCAGARSALPLMPGAFVNP